MQASGETMTKKFLDALKNLEPVTKEEISAKLRGRGLVHTGAVAFESDVFRPDLAVNLDQGEAEKMPESEVKQFIIDLAATHNITYVRTNLDQLAETITELSGDTVQTDSIQDLLVALKRSKKITESYMVELLIRYLRETKVSSND